MILSTPTVAPGRKTPRHRRNGRLEETSPGFLPPKRGARPAPEQRSCFRKGWSARLGYIARDLSKTTSVLIEHAHLDVQLAAIVPVVLVGITVVAPASPPLPFPRGLPPPLALSGALTTTAAAATTCGEREAGVKFVSRSRTGVKRRIVVRGAVYPSTAIRLLGARFTSALGVELTCCTAWGLCRGPEQTADLCTYCCAESGGGTLL